MRALFVYAGAPTVRVQIAAVFSPSHTPSAVVVRLGVRRATSLLGPMPLG